MVVLISRMFCRRARGTLGGYLGDVCRLVYVCECAVAAVLTTD